MRALFSIVYQLQTERHALPFGNTGERSALEQKQVNHHILRRRSQFRVVHIFMDTS